MSSLGAPPGVVCGFVNGIPGVVLGMRDMYLVDMTRIQKKDFFECKFKSMSEYVMSSIPPGVELLLGG